MKMLVPAIISGFTFGFGLAISGMTDTNNIIAFLNISPEWKMNLAVVMATALSITIPGFWWLKRKDKPVLTEQFDAPNKTEINKPLLIGSSLFGLGWGIVGYCPGPAVGALYYGHGSTYLFVSVMIMSGLITKYALSYKRPNSAKLTTSLPPMTK